MYCLHKFYYVHAAGVTIHKTYF